MTLWTPINSRVQVWPYLSGEAPDSPNGLQVRNECPLGSGHSHYLQILGCHRDSESYIFDSKLTPQTSSHTSWFGYGVRCSILITDIHVRRLNRKQWNTNWLFRCRHGDIKRERSHRVLNWRLTSISAPSSTVGLFDLWSSPPPPPSITFVSNILPGRLLCSSLFFFLYTFFVTCLHI